MCAVCAALPDLDLLYMPTHRTATHSVRWPPRRHCRGGCDRVGQTVRDWLARHFGDRRAGRHRTGVRPRLSSHILLDWLGADTNPPYGVQALWPFSDMVHLRAEVFPGTQRRDPLSTRAMLINLRAAVMEIVIMGAVCWQ